MHAWIIIANQLEINSINSGVNIFPFCALSLLCKQQLESALCIYCVRQFVELEPFLCSLKSKMMKGVGSDWLALPTLTGTFLLTRKGSSVHSDLSPCVCMCAPGKEESMGMVVSVCPVSV